MTRLRIAAALTLTGAGLFIAGTAITAGTGPALLVAGAISLLIGLFGIDFKVAGK